jgi:hypothetical protein
MMLDSAAALAAIPLAFRYSFFGRKMPAVKASVFASASSEPSRTARNPRS